MKTKTITVMAAPDRTVPIHATDNPHGGNVLLKPGEMLEVVESTTVRRAIRSGDLIVAKGETSAKHVDTSMKLDEQHADLQAKKAPDSITKAVEQHREKPESK